MWETAKDRLRGRLADGLAQSGLTLPWWVPLGTTAFTVIGLVVAVGQRVGPALPVAIAGFLLATSSTLLWICTGRLAPSWLKALGVLAGTGLLLTHPVVPDFAPMPMIVLAGELGSIAPPRVAFASTGGAIAVLGAAALTVGLVGAPVYQLAVVVGMAAGFMLRWYVRALDAERGKQEAVREQAMLGERQRIAREVHDVVAHSLSITLLHVTGARHGLRTDRDIDEAVAALTEAERIGRAAMADIRRTVGLLAQESAGTRALPGAGDLADLVAETCAAGLAADYELEGDVTAVDATVGLGLYRIAQESLANVVKHAPGEKALVRLEIGGADARLTVRNGHHGAARGSGGSGLAGMAARADQLGARLTAGPEGGEWVVDVTVPLAREAGS
ncbi:sensor histidine kinase [Amycolatopsis sp. VS8301801F10]|uniref:sensor histidine kinase n=1 Tax=Amycolatopsis sp. VS8301801F10 TaxID=2652442 RepID=UPI0038FC1EEA